MINLPPIDHFTTFNLSVGETTISFKTLALNESQTLTDPSFPTVATSLSEFVFAVMLSTGLRCACCTTAGGDLIGSEDFKR
ncbi:hypothetical protein WICPIJ_003316 [Wickerhamomyces pijperi]|uniref:Uncharacterized protein n=1 Tax=Wickerhamomyces pijperi TaxID=599730 RepID=A0A9P8TPC6_WICPI|nr:hypothetical protein WICPIJ_003316 [Wickerhamomyces pijperi]